MDLTNAWEIVTGGAGGFGAATVRRLAHMGAKVVIADVSDERGEALASAGSSPVAHLTVACLARGAQAATRPEASGRLASTQLPRRLGIGWSKAVAGTGMGCYGNRSRSLRRR